MLLKKVNIHATEVAAAINKASMNMVQVESTKLVQQRGNHLEPGQAVFTEAGGSLKCKYVIHTVGPEGYIHGLETTANDFEWLA